MANRTNEFQSIRSEGGLLPPDLLHRIINAGAGLEGTNPADYGLPESERLNETITQSWTRLRKHWAEFCAAAKNLPEGEPGTGLTNDKWNLPLLRELGFGLLPTGAGPEIAGRTYAINRFSGHAAIHLVGSGLSLDRRAAGVRGAAMSNPHGLVQEFLNRSPGHLWAIVSNGLRFRILRDNQALSRQSYLEFDLATMFSGEIYSDFVLLWMVSHATRFTAKENDRADSCWLEKWTKLANEQGTRALESLKGGVEKALEVLGQGFVGHSHNTGLRAALRNGSLSLADLHGQLLRVVYRLIFLFVAEERTLDGVPLLHPRDETEPGRLARERYSAHYSTGRLRDLAAQIKGSRHGDLWQQFNLLVGALSGEERFSPARTQLALPVFGSMLWAPASTSALNATALSNGEGVELTNADFLDALRHLAFTRQGKILRPVDYKNLGSEELGGVYESLLALTPQISGDGNRFTFAEFAGNERKTSGSYYTPDSLVQCLLDSALDPVVSEAIKGKAGGEAEKALLSLKICDPAVGSGHFLVGAAHRMARHLARVRAQGLGESEPSPLLYQHALRDIIGHCLFGVDINPMSAELCRVSLWLEALEPGKPLSFLDHHIRVGNSLLGTTPALLEKGIPDVAFDAIEGDDKKVCTLLKKRNKKEREGLQVSLLASLSTPVVTLGNLTKTMAELDLMDDDSPEHVAEKQHRFEEFINSQDYMTSHLLADAWCSAFVMKKDASVEFPITHDTFRKIQENPFWTPKVLKDEIGKLRNQYQFFHWHLEFPEVFEKGGFDCVLGNPPWEMQEVKDNEFFASSYPEILAVKSAKDKAQILQVIEKENPSLWRDYQEYFRMTYSQKHFMLDSCRYPLSAVGRLNLYRVFLETSQTIIGRYGQIGIVIPSGFASDSFSQSHFTSLHQGGQIRSLYDFANAEGIFPGVHRNMSFCILTLSGALGTSVSTDFLFFASGIEELFDPLRHLSMTAEEIRLLNPLTGTAPLFRNEKDRLISIALHQNRPIVADNSEEGWRIKPILMYMVNASMTHHKTADELIQAGYKLEGNHFVGEGDRWLPLYEGKMVGSYDHRAASIRFDANNRVRRNQPDSLSEDEHIDPTLLAQPLFWVSSDNVTNRCGSIPHYCMAIKDVTARTNERTSIAAILPAAALTDSVPWICNPQDAVSNACLLGVLNSFCFDFAARQKVAGLHLRGHYFAQLPILAFKGLETECCWQHGTVLRNWLGCRVLELTYTAWDLEPFAHDFTFCAPPFYWDKLRRFMIRCELDAAFFHLYLGTEKEWKSNDSKALIKSFPTPRHAIDYIMETFPTVKRRDEAEHGRYLTKDTILEIYDEMQRAMSTGTAYQTRLDPPPADVRCCHPESTRPAWAPKIQPKPEQQPQPTAGEPVLLSFRRIPRPKHADRYTDNAPLLTLKAAAGTFSDGEAVEFEDWVQFKTAHKMKKGWFVAQVIGVSMEPEIPNGAYCLFRPFFIQNLKDQILLVQHRSLYDPETSGDFVVKRVKRIWEDGNVTGVQLISANPKNPIQQIRGEIAGELSIKAELVEVLK